MVVRNVIVGICIFVAVSFAQSADTTLKPVVPQQISATTASVKTENPTLKKQATIRRPTSTWSKIKDLFM